MPQTNANGLTVRAAQDSDASQLCILLNEIIAIGGSTAYQAPLTEEQFSSKFLTGDGIVSCFVAVGGDGALLGFQWVTQKESPPDNWGDIATFAKANTTVRGIGTALFVQTREQALAAGLVAINATIRADNVSGLGYYSKMGFEDYDLIRDVPLNDGALVDRVRKRYDLA